MHCKTCGNYLVDEGGVCKVCGTVATSNNAPIAPTTNDSSEGSWPWGDTTNSSAPTTAQNLAPNNSTVNVPTANPANTGGGLFSQTMPNPSTQNTVSTAPSVGQQTEAPARSSSEANAPQSDSNRIFDFSWNNEAFPTEEPKEVENIEFEWGTFDPHAKPEPVQPVRQEPAVAEASKQIADIGRAARQRDAQEMAERRVAEAETIFSNDTADFSQPSVDPAIYSQNNETFQEFLDNEVDKVQNRQTSIDESRNQINNDFMSAPVKAPDTIISDREYDPSLSIDDRIASFLEKADREMLEAMNARINQQIQEKDSEENNPVISPEEAVRPTTVATPVVAPAFVAPEESQGTIPGIPLPDEKIGTQAGPNGLFDANVFNASTNEEIPTDNSLNNLNAQIPSDANMQNSENDDVFLISDIFAEENTAPAAPSSFEAPTSQPEQNSPFAGATTASPFENPSVDSKDIFSSFESADEPIRYDIPATENAPLAEDFSLEKSEPIVDSIPVSNFEPMGGNMPVDNIEPTVDSIPVSNFEPMGDSIPVSNFEPMGDSIPVSNFEPMGGNMPVDNIEPTVDSIPVSNFEPMGERQENDAISRPPVTEGISIAAAGSGIASFMANLDSAPNDIEEQSQQSPFGTGNAPFQNADQKDTEPATTFGPDSSSKVNEELIVNEEKDSSPSASQSESEEIDILEELMNSNMASIEASKATAEPTSVLPTESFLEESADAAAITDATTTDTATSVTESMAALEDMDTKDETTPVESESDNSIASAFAGLTDEKPSDIVKPDSFLFDLTDDEIETPEEDAAEETTSEDFTEVMSSEEKISELGDLTPLDPDRINEPVVFPFDLEPDEDDKSEAKLVDRESKRADKFDKEIKMSDSKEHLKSAKAEAKEAKRAAREEYKKAMAEAKGKPYKAPASKAPAYSAPAQNSTETKDSRSENYFEPEPKKSKALFIVVDVVVVLAILGVCSFAILRFAPESGAAELLQNGITKIVGIFDKSADEEEINPIDEEFAEAANLVIPPTADLNTLVNSQLYSNKNIKNIMASPDAVFQSDKPSTIEGVSASMPIENNYWTDGDQGQVFYDEQAVATVIRFNSNLVSYINENNQAIFDDIEMGSNAEPKLAEFIASIDKIDFTTLGIGEIRTDGKNFFVWTVETITETVNAKESQQTYKRVYKLSPDIDTMKVSDFEEIK